MNLEQLRKTTDAQIKASQTVTLGETEWRKIMAVVYAAESFATGQGERVVLIKALMALEE